MEACLYDRMVGAERLLEQIGRKTSELQALVEEAEEMGPPPREGSVSVPHLDLQRVHRHLLDGTDNRALNAAREGTVSLTERYWIVAKVNKGWRRFFPRKKVEGHTAYEGHNASVAYLSELLGNLDHLRTRGRLALDNSVAGFVYGAVLGEGLGYAFASFVVKDVPDPALSVSLPQFVGLVSAVFVGLYSGFLAQAQRVGNDRDFLRRAQYLDAKLAEHYKTLVLPSID